MAHSHFLVELLYGPLGPENGPQLAEHIIGYSAKSGEYISGSWQFELLARHTTKKKNIALLADVSNRQTDEHVQQ